MWFIQVSLNPLFTYIKCSRLVTQDISSGLILYSSAKHFFSKQTRCDNVNFVGWHIRNNDYCIYITGMVGNSEWPVNNTVCCIREV